MSNKATFVLTTNCTKSICFQRLNASSVAPAGNSSDWSRVIAVRTLSTSAEMWLSRDKSPHSSRSDAKKSTTPSASPEHSTHNHFLAEG